jgi:hypothetical protein
LTRERVVAGLAAARRRGRVGGRPAAISGEKLDAVLAALNGGMSKAAVCRNFGVKRTTLIQTLAPLDEPDLTRTTERNGMMGGVDTADDLWILAPGDHALVMSKRGRTRLGFAILLAFFCDRVRFPRHESEVDPQGIATLSQQLNVRAPVDGEAFLAGRTAERMRSEIRVRFGFREATVADSDPLSEWLREHAAAEAAGDDAGPHPLRAPTTCYPSVNWRLQAPPTPSRLLVTTLYAGRYS